MSLPVGARPLLGVAASVSAVLVGEIDATGVDLDQLGDLDNLTRVVLVPV